MFENPLRPKDGPVSNVQIYKFSDVSQYIVSANAQEFHFVTYEDAERFARHLSPSTRKFTIENIVQGQAWDRR